MPGRAAESSLVCSLSKSCFVRFLALFLGTQLFLVDSGSAQDEVARPVMDIASPTYDFGSVIQGTVVQANFEIKNTGSADLHIERIIPGCGCTAVSSSSDVIAPNQSGAVQIDFDTAGFNGEKSRAIRLYTNDPKNPVYTLTIKGKVDSDIDVTPAAVRFESARIGDLLSKKVDIKVKQGSDTKILSVKTFNPGIKVSINESSDSHYNFDVSLQPTLKAGDLRGRVIVNLTGAKSRSINVPVFANIKGAIQVEPAVVSLGVIEDRSSVIQKNVKFVNHGKEPISILSVHSNNDAVSAKLKEIKAGSIYVLDLTIDPKLIQRNLRATVEIDTSLKDQPKVPISVYGVFPPAIG